MRDDGTPDGCGIIVAYPHTSNFYFIVAIAYKWATGLLVAFLGKPSVFTAPA